MANDAELVLFAIGLMESSYSDLVTFDRFLDGDRDILSVGINFATIKKAEVDL